jgi:integrase/recombinase XerD
LSGNRASELVSAYLTAAGHSGSCHRLRHAISPLMLDGGADIRYIQAMLGHADLVTTEVYTRAGVTKLKAVHSDTHPARLAGTRGAAASSR